MPKKTRSTEEVDAVREKILACAFEILVKNGYEGLSMAKVGARMKMTAANLYNYYANKDELLIAIHKKAYAMLYDQLGDAVQKAKTPQARFQKLTQAFVTFGTQNINIYDIMFNRRIRQHSDYIGTPQEALSDDEFRSSLRVRAFAEGVIQEVCDAKEDGRAPDARFLAIQATSILHGVISLYNSGVLAQITADPEATLKQIVENTTRNITG
ncbi:MAG: TetR/AcrR family transcriptional regulator [Desulfobacteraceae bacterium]|nr:TetR/AcrR family transcriptional regulator [Desulfobacteraceae bacterium]